MAVARHMLHRFFQLTQVPPRPDLTHDAELFDEIMTNEGRLTGRNSFMMYNILVQRFGSCFLKMVLIECSLQTSFCQ